MTASASVNELIQIAIQTERATEELYRRLTRMFAHVPEIVRFIERYAAEEAGHAVWLESLRSKLTAEKLAAPAVPLIYEDAERVAQRPILKVLDRIETLEDAYQLLVETILGEANQVLAAMINTYYEDETTRVFLLDNLYQHQQRIEAEFPRQYDSRRARQSVRAVRA